MTNAALLALTVMGLTWAVSGVVVATPGRLPGPPVAGVALAVAGLGAVAGAALEATGRHQGATHVFSAAFALALPVAVTAYPRWAWRHPVDFVALVTLVGAGVLLTVQQATEDVVTPSVIVIACVLVAHTWWKLEHADARARSALVWLSVAGASAGLVGMLLVFIASTAGGVVVGALAFALVGPAMAVGAARPEILDVRRVVVQVVVVATALVCYIAVFVGLAALVEVVLARPATTGELAVLGGLVALAVPPLRTVLHGVVDELLFGARSDPLEAAAHVAGRSAGDPVLALRAVREALVLPFAALRVDGETLASSGVSSTATHTVVLTAGEERVGELEVGLRPGELSLTSADEHVLGLVAPLLALTVRSSTMAVELQQAREQSVTALEEERRRLRRDLHDGLGPRLSGIAFTADAARNSVRADPVAAEDLLARLRAETTTAIEEIRELVYAMRPPALDELGLVRAIRQQALSLRTPGGAPLRLVFAAPEALPPLTAAVEVAAYRITIEALTNVVRHSGSDRAELRLWCADGELGIEVSDVGGTGSGAWSAGVGRRACGSGPRSSAAPSRQGPPGRAGWCGRGCRWRPRRLRR